MTHPLRSLPVAFRTDEPVSLGRGRLRAQLDAHRWQRVSARVVTTHNGPLGGDQQRQLALLVARPGSALAGPTAAAIDGLTGFEDPATHIVMPPGSRVRQNVLGPVVVHYSSRLGEDQVHPGRSPRRTRIERSLVDMAGWSQQPIRACAVLAAGVQQRLVRPAALELAVQSAGPIRHRRHLLLALADIAGGSQSFAEIDVIRLCRRAGLPPPTRQAVRRDRSGRRRYLDLHWPAYNLVVEIDGGLHCAAARWWDDLARQNELVLRGELVLRFPTVLVRIQPSLVIDQIAAGLRRGGWVG